ncbi:MAG: peptidylprolyl isomerase [Acidobacteria bacterium]|nr:peptidylprolyl isomerase [Acidobacteriota bacterium]
MRLGLLIGIIALTAAPALAQGTGAGTGQAATPGAGPVLVFETEKGTFEIETYQSQAPKTVAHIVGLVNKRFYNGLRVHRVVRNFVVQVGDPQTRDMTKKEMWGTGGSGTSIGVAEFSKTFKHGLGVVSMAHAGDPTKADSQFFIVIGPASHLDGKHQIWGKVIGNGMDVVNKLAVDDRIVRATVKGAK